MSGVRQSLGLRFYGALLVVFTIGTVVFGFFVARRAGRDFEERADRALVAASVRVDGLVDETAKRQADLMDGAVRQLSENVGRELDDVPFDVFEAREDLLLEYLKERLDAARRRHADNSKIIADYLQDQAHKRLREDLEKLKSEQRAGSRELARDVFRDMLLWGGLFLLGLSAGVGAVFYYTVLRPLRAATDVIEEIRGGERDRRLEIEGADEIARLSRAFNAMADDIARSHGELERRVEEKTAALRGSLEDQQRVNEKLERTQEKLVDQAKMVSLGTMAQGMAHEFNNVLGGIRGCTEELLDEARHEDRELLDVILRTSQRAGVITDNLLRFSRGGDRGRRRGRLDEGLSEAVRLLEPESEKSGVTIVTDIDETPDRLTDVEGLQQVFLNLLGNALDAARSGGRIDVRLTEGENETLIEIADDGEGMTEKDRRRIFEPFFTTKDPSTGDRGGCGLGLAVSIGIVGALGGTIEASSPGPGLGSTFNVVLPHGEAS